MATFKTFTVSTEELQQAGFSPYEPRSREIKARLRAISEQQKHATIEREIAELESSLPPAPTAEERQYLAFRGKRPYDRQDPDRDLPEKVAKYDGAIRAVGLLRERLANQEGIALGAESAVTSAQNEVAKLQEYQAKQEALRVAREALYAQPAGGQVFITKK